MSIFSEIDIFSAYWLQLVFNASHFLVGTYSSTVSEAKYPVSNVEVGFT